MIDPTEKKIFKKKYVSTLAKECVELDTMKRLTNFIVL